MTLARICLACRQILPDACAWETCWAGSFVKNRRARLLKKAGRSLFCFSSFVISGPCDSERVLKLLSASESRALGRFKAIFARFRCSALNPRGE